MLSLEHIYTFPLFLPIARPWCTPLEQGPAGVFGFGIKAITEPTSIERNPFSFFQIDLNKGDVSHQQLSLPAANFMRLCYQPAQERWVMSVNGETLTLYGLPASGAQACSTLWRIGGKTVGAGYKDLKAVWTRGEHMSLLFWVWDVAEVSDPRMYWACWESAAVEQEVPRPIGYSDVVVPVISEEGCLLFCCQRSFQKEPAADQVRQGPGNWQLALVSYSQEGALLHQEIVPDVALPIRNVKYPLEDFCSWLTVSMVVAEGPHYALWEEEVRRPTWIAALDLRDRSSEQEERKGGLYCIDLRGHVLQHDSSPLGERISLCSSGDTVIGTDVVSGEGRRLWRWVPGGKRKECGSLDPLALRATLLPRGEQDVWCIEEYIEGVKVSVRGGEELEVKESVWCDGMTLLDELAGPFLREQRLKSLATYQDTLLLLGRDREQRLKLWSVK